MSDPGCSEETCKFGIWHGPRHAARTTCVIVGEHEIHQTFYGAARKFAQWRGDADVKAGFYDEPPEFDGD